MAEEFIIAGWMDYGENRDKVLAPFIDVAVASREEPGCLDYTVCADPEDAGRIIVFERWTSEPDLVEHFEMPYIAEFRAAIGPYPRLARDIRRYFISRGEEFESAKVGSTLG
ncbi:MAG TPA: putative quinol monooxygenase [Pseudonocardiaceae bacterium]|jgi:quinol monooxygenase YgiN